MTISNLEELLNRAPTAEAVQLAGQRHVLRLYREAARPGSPLRGLLKHCGALATVLNDATPTLERLSRPRLAAKVDAALAESAEPVGFDERLRGFAQDFGLSAAESTVLGFAAVCEAYDTLDSVLEDLEGHVARDTAQIIAFATGLDVKSVRATLLPHALLIASGLLRPSRYGPLSERLSLLDGVAAGLTDDTSSSPLAHRFLSTAALSTLTLDDYAHHAEDVALIRDLLAGALRTRAAGVQVLLHGAPGTGKTELARLLAHSVGQAFEVPDADRDGDALDNSKRLRRYTFLLRLLGGSGGRVLVFDEIEELLGSQDQLGWVAAGRSAMAGQKSWKNRLLETAAVPTIWIANSLAAIDPALLRRFALVLQVQQPPRSRRVALLHKSAGALAHEPRVKRVLEDEATLTAADIERARRAMELARPEGDASTFLRALALRAAAPLRSESGHHFATVAYRLDWLNTTPPMADVIARLALRKSGRLCFAGVPGTGKTALAQHLAKTLGLPLHVKKASDLLGMYLGETEANLADAFAEARREDAVLLLDEADSFLRSREHAVRSWEVTQVNQLLKEIEDHDGIVVICTNHFAALDEAVLRRLDLKVRFERLTATSAREAFFAAAEALGITTHNAEAVLIAQPYAAGVLALGDFAAALRQAQLRSDAPDAVLLRECVDAEVAAREAQKGRRMGFMAALQ